MKKWMLFIALAVPWFRKLWIVFELVNIDCAQLNEPIMALKLLVTEVICLAMIELAITAALQQKEEEEELLEARRELRKLRAKK